MKLSTIVNAVPALQKLAATNLSPRTLYWISKLMAKVDRELAFFNREREKIVRELGKEVEGGKWEIPAENRETLDKRIADLLDIDIDDDDLKVAKIPTTEPITMSYNELRTLEGLVELELDE